MIYKLQLSRLFPGDVDLWLLTAEKRTKIRCNEESPFRVATK